MHLGTGTTTLTFICALMLGALAAPPAQAQTFTVLHSFTGGSSDGSDPYAGVILDNEGNLYGDTQTGGSSDAGTVFMLDTSGTETLLHTFNGSDGLYPVAPLLRDAKGNLYGTTQQGGDFKGGTVFKLTKGGKLTLLHSFAGGTTDGCDPLAGVIRDAQGNLYGTTSGCGSYGPGAVFKLSKKGKLTLLHSFAGGKKDGSYPGGVILDDRGNLYGDTGSGGSSNYGTVFKLGRSGKFTLLHSFTGWITDGCYPLGSLVTDASKNLYGTTRACGSSGYGEGDGVVFRVDARGAETLLHSFIGSDGASPYAGVLRDSEGNFYGTTQSGGSADFGTVFKLSKSGELTTLHSFSGSDGFFPAGDVVRDAAGTLYGTTYYGGSSDQGTVWKLTP